MRPDDIQTYRILAGIDPCVQTSSCGTGMLQAEERVKAELRMAYLHCSFAPAFNAGLPWAVDWFGGQAECAKGSHDLRDTDRPWVQRCCRCGEPNANYDEWYASRKENSK